MKKSEKFDLVLKAHEGSHPEAVHDAVARCPLAVMHTADVVAVSVWGTGIYLFKNRFGSSRAWVVSDEPAFALQVYVRKHSGPNRAAFLVMLSEPSRPRLLDPNPEPIPMILTCPSCKVRHVDEGEYATKPHHTHACQGCGLVWRPAKVATVGVRFLPGYKNA